mmetsp:Transcript_18138/g.27353  ORF Transcript_18138/g.27353 Transcript_18138/m.27353 type:complete len:162 (-) Transcript_18138:29-514(-)
MFRLAAVFAGVVAVASASVVELDAAVDLEETCDNEECAVELRQLRAKKAEAEVTAHSKVEADAEVDACSYGLMPQIRRLAPECFRMCPEICAPLNQAIDSYANWQGAPGATRAVCHHIQAFKCPLTTAHSQCRELLQKTSEYGMVPPTSYSQLQATCARSP